MKRFLVVLLAAVVVGAGALPAQATETFKGSIVCGGTRPLLNNGSKSNGYTLHMQGGSDWYDTFTTVRTKYTYFGNSSSYVLTQVTADISFYGAYCLD